MASFYPIRRRLFRTPKSVADVYRVFHRWSARIAIVAGMLLLLVELCRGLL